MASVSTDKNGLKRILFTDGGGNRKAIRMGDVAMKIANDVARRVEAINVSLITRTPLDAEKTLWVSKLPDHLYAKLERVGLVEPRVRRIAWTIGDMLTAFFDGVDVKPASRVRMEQARASLESHFLVTQELRSISPTDAEAWRAGLKSEGYAPATISRSVLYARQFFRWAIKQGMTGSNPFADLKAGSQANRDRQVMIDRDTITKVSAAAPNAEWRLLIALSRYGGLRVPSEALLLTWDDVNWSENRLLVRSPKTEHHEGKAERFVPIFPELREPLLELFSNAADGTKRIISSYEPGANLNPQLRRIIKRAGVLPWPRTWHNMRASRQTELASQFPLHTVCAWMGNSKLIASAHYLQVTDADWMRATGGAESGARVTQNAAQQASAPDREEPRDQTQAFVVTRVAQNAEPPCEAPQDFQMGRAGLEPATPAFSMRCSTN